ncbi:exodeoxyribonuclease V subunit alpha [uncultured Thiohalocapsa sp.]|uniref:exodeoxyribonuclease V subunit alpha n=1 Tax=uncultured Thiohalocapsa sp. TaxID=768990 RepID=UPI0025E08277|nr:exodeoxyribonuclease V subunit alpha [uncultured Thiohalocapsa sp.]
MTTQTTLNRLLGDHALPAPTQALLEQLQTWVQARALRSLDLALTQLMATQGGDDPAVLLATALVCERNGHGHVCLSLADALEQPHSLFGRLPEDRPDSAQTRGELHGLLNELRLDDWRDALAVSPVVDDRLSSGGQGDDADDDADIGAQRPLVLAGSATRPLLYLRRYWAYEQAIRDGIDSRLQQDRQVNSAVLTELLERLFDQTQDEHRSRPDWQRIACALAARSAFSIVTGGPGTGKTTTVVKLLAVLHGLAEAAGQPPLLIELAAPTGKAAARLTESIRQTATQIPEDLRPTDLERSKVKTLHRLLGHQRRGGFRYNAAHHLPADIVVVDEASMVDVEMMANLLAAMRPTARLILLGDKDQLSSVEAGAVLGDLCRNAHHGRYRQETLAYLVQTGSIAPTEVPQHLFDPQGEALDQSITLLRRSYRFRSEGGIGALAAEVNREHPGAGAERLEGLQAIFDANRDTDPGLGRIDARSVTRSTDPALRDLLIESLGASPSYLHVMQMQRPGPGAEQPELDAWAGEVLEAQKRFQLLTPLRNGDWGVEGLNRQIYAWLCNAPQTASCIGQGRSHDLWFRGRPVLVTRNDYALDLMNGDIGMTLATPERAGGERLRVAFPRADGGIRWVLPSRLQDVETVFAMTVHKSQGSEFEHAALLMPARSNPVLTRELLYTAITRAKQRFSLIYGSDAVLGETLTRRVQRVSGLN